MLVCTPFFMSTFTINIKAFALFWMSFKAFIISAIRYIFTNLIVMISLAIFSKLAKKTFWLYLQIFSLLRCSDILFCLCDSSTLKISPWNYLVSCYSFIFFQDQGHIQVVVSLSLHPSRSCFLLYLLVQLISSRLGALCCQLEFLLPVQCPKTLSLCLFYIYTFPLASF